MKGRKTRKFLANVASMTCFWDRDLRHRVRNSLSPTNPERCIKYLEQYCTEKAPAPTTPSADGPTRCIVWQYWAQGLAHCPDIVRQSIQSVDEFLPQGYTHIVITAESLQQYIDLPAYIREAKEKNAISVTHFSDILRVWLLDKYGGIWIDATCLLTATIPDEILQKPFFCYLAQGEFAYTYIQSCFIKAEAHHPLIHRMCQTLERYWQEEGAVIHYFTFHFIFIALLRTNPDFLGQFQQAQLRETDAAMHFMFYALRRGRNFSTLLIQQAARQSFIHKLTYKEPWHFSPQNADITLLVSTYNWPRALQLCIESVSRQTQLPCEVIIADDGSGEETRLLIGQLQQRYPELDIQHVWQPDEGFRKTIILNKAIAKARGEYIVQIDGDVVLDSHFLADHAELMERGYYVCGSRTKVERRETEAILASGQFHLHATGLKPTFILNRLRNKTLRHYMALRYARKIDHLRGCNMAFWRSDFIAVNGYNENLCGWGHEDGELIYRMHFAGVKKKALKMGGVLYHLWHQEASKAGEGTHLKELEHVVSQQIKWCENGVNKYLNTQQEEGKP